MQLGAITPTQWLQRMADLTQCQSAYVISWTPGIPESPNTSGSDETVEFAGQWVAWADNLIRQCKPERPGLLDDIARTAGATDEPDTKPLPNHDPLIAYFDSDPAITLLVLGSHNRPEGWNDDDRKQIKMLLPALFKAHLVHKKLSRSVDMSDIANNALDAIPRAIIGMTPNAEIVKANGAAHALLDGNIFAATNGHLVIHDAKIMRQFSGKLAELRSLAPESISQFIWNRSFHKEPDAHHYQLALRGFAHESWRLESNRHDRFALLVIGSPQIRISPKADQLRDFYDLSNAQARVVLSLLEGNDIMTSAAKLNISINTIRSHMRAIYAKLGVDNQRDLLRILFSTLVDYRDTR
jgi:DNA-binding CsgD family transcriptional regulator